MFNRSGRQVVKQLIQRCSYVTETTASRAAASTTTTNTNTILPYAVQEPPKYVLSTLRSFPSLEPTEVIPVANEFLNTPLRRDILWRAAVMEADCSRVGSSNPPGRGEHKFSGRKLMPQKGNGRARVGDGNSPIRINGARAHARSAPNDFSTDLPFQIYANAYRVALSEYYRKGNLFIIGNKDDFNIPTSDYHAIEFFINTHNLKNLNLLFITSDIIEKDESLTNLAKAIRHYPSHRLNMVDPESLEVRDLLKANRIYIQREALEKLAIKYAQNLI